MSDILILIGRSALGGLFVAAGLLHCGGMSAVSGLMTRNGVAFAQPLLLVGTVFQIAAGALLIAGLFVSFAAFGLVAFTVAATAMVLRFWELPEGLDRHMATNAFLSNVGIIGGLLIAAATAN